MLIHEYKQIFRRKIDTVSISQNNSSRLPDRVYDFLTPRTFDQVYKHHSHSRDGFLLFEAGLKSSQKAVGYPQSRHYFTHGDILPGRSVL